MLNKKKQNLAILLAIFLTCSIMALTIGPNFQGSNVTFDYDTTSLNISTLYPYTVINDILPGSTWEDAKSGGICTGSGTIGDPYIIKDDIFEYGGIGPGECLEIRNSRKYFILRNCTIINADQNSVGLYLENVTNGLIDDCIVNNDAETGCTGIRMDNVNNTEIKESYIYDNTGNGIWLTNSHFNTLRNNNISSNGINGIYLDTNCEYNIISGNTANYNGNDGINSAAFLGFNANNDFIQNTVNHNGDNGLYISWDIDSIIQKNTAYNNTLRGIDVYIGDNITCSQNTVYENKNDGIRYASVINSVLENNNGHHNGMNGIRLQGGCLRNIIESNTLRYNNLSGIFLDLSVDVNLVMNNLASNNVEHGIHLSQSDTNTLSGNTANSNGINGIHLESSNDNTIIANTANNNKNGTFLDTSNNNQIINNNLLGNGDCYNETGSTGNIFVDNICTGAVGPAIDLSTILLIICIIEGIALAAIIAIYFVRKRKS